MLSALKPNESIYDITKFYKKLNRLKLLKQKNNHFNKISLPKLSSTKILEQNLAQSISISGKNSFKIHKINLNYNFSQNDISNIINNNIYESKQVLSENNIKLPEVEKKKNYMSENNSPLKINKNCNSIYLKYEGRENNTNEIKKKIYIEIFPHKIIHTLKNIIHKNDDMINNLEKHINKIMVDKYTTMTNLIHNLTTDFKTIDADYNEILNTAESKYLLLTEKNNHTNNSDKHIFRIKNVFLEKIIKNVITHAVEIRNKKNQIILKEDLEEELNHQLELLKKFFDKITKQKNLNKFTDRENSVDINNTKIIKIKKHLIKTYNKIIFQNFDENENNINSVINNVNKGYLTERNNRNIEIFNVFKSKLGMTSYQSIHTLYSNIVTNRNISQNIKQLEDKKISTDNIPINNKIKKLNNNKQLGVLNFYEKYQEMKNDLNINNKKRGNDNNELIFDLGPNLKIVEFDEIAEEINDINNTKHINNTQYINNEKLFFQMLSYNKININQIKNKHLSKLFGYKSKKYNTTKKKKLIKSSTDISLDILDKIGNKLHKKIKIKIGNKVKEKKSKIRFDPNKTEYLIKNKEEDESNNNNLTEERQVNTETNSSMFSDIPSDFNMSYSEIKKEKEEKAKQIREIIENTDNFNESKIIDIDELFFNGNKTKQEKKVIKKKSIELDKEIDNNETDIKIKDNEKEKQKKIEDNKKIDDKKNVNMTNIIIKNKINNRKIKYIHMNEDTEKIKSKYSNNSTSTNKNRINKETNKSTNIPPKLIIKKNEQNHKNISNSIKTDKKDNQENKDKKDNQNKSDNKIKEEITLGKDEKNKITPERKIKNERSTNRRKTKNEKYSKNRRKTNRKRTRTKINEFKFKKGNVSNDIENDIINDSYEKIMIFFNDRFNIPGKNNKTQQKKISSKSFSQKISYTTYYQSSISDDYYSVTKTKTNIFNLIEKDKLIRNKSFSFIKTKNDKKLILIKPILKYVLYKKNTNKKQIRDSIIKVFSVSYVNLLDLKPPNKARNIKEFQMKRMSFDYYGNNASKRNHQILMEKYFGPKTKIEKKYYRDDNDLSSNYSKISLGIKFFKKKRNIKKGFKAFMNNYENYEKNNNNLWVEKFENNKKENERIRNLIEAKRNKKKKNIEEIENQLNNFKSYINSLKNMTEEQFKYDAIRFINKIESNRENFEIATKVRRINEFKNYIKTNEMNKLNNNKYILKDVLFQSNCVFYTDKIFKV